MNGKLYTIVAVRNPSLLEEQQGIGAVILAGPTTLPASGSYAACVQFGVNHAADLVEAPAGLLEISVREGV